MDKEILKSILNSKHLMVPLIFTSKQILIIKKYLENKTLSNSEKKSLYTSISKKSKALASLTIGSNDFYIKGAEYIIPERLLKAKEIILNLKKKCFVSGSFLTKKKYNDIDVFILIEKGYKEEYKNNFHYIYLTKKKLKNAKFQSSVLISVGNFNNTMNYQHKMPSLHELMSIYNEAIIEILQKDSKKESLRELIFLHNVYCKNILLNQVQLSSILLSSSIKECDSYFKELCKYSFSRLYLYVEFSKYIKSLESAMLQTKNIENLKHSKQIYGEIINESRTAKA